MQDKIDSLEDDKAALQAEIDAIQVKITQTEQDIADAQAKLTKSRLNLTRPIRFIAKGFVQCIYQALHLLLRCF